jgi:lysophospholipase L1-like esterase
MDMERQASQVVRQIGRERGLEVVDVQAALGKDPRYYADFSHFTDEGAARVAAALADPLQALGRDLRRAANQ